VQVDKRTVILEMAQRLLSNATRENSRTMSLQTIHIRIPSTRYLMIISITGGIIALGAFTNFGTEANGFSELFPGIHLSVLTLGTNFKTPFWRELLLGLGFCSVSKRSCENILALEKGRSCMIVVGGASESIVCTFKYL